MQISQGNYVFLFLFYAHMSNIYRNLKGKSDTNDVFPNDYSNQYHFYGLHIQIKLFQKKKEKPRK